MSKERIDHGAALALRKIGSPEGWSVCSWEIMDDDSTVYGMMLESGTKPDGSTKWVGPEKKACVTKEERIAEINRYETETGKCSVCYGTGDEWMGWNHITGNRWGKCRRCNGLGLAARAK
jgi:hypothetical protein